MILEMKIAVFICEFVGCFSVQTLALAIFVFFGANLDLPTKGRVPKWLTNGEIRFRKQKGERAQVFAGKFHPELAHNCFITSGQMKEDDWDVFLSRSPK